MEGTVAETQNGSTGSRDVLTEILRQGARDMLAKAIENEVAEYTDRHAHVRDEQGHRLVVRNGYLPARTIQTGLGDVPVRQPRVRDGRRDEHGRRMRFTSRILPPYLRRTRSVEELLPWLYLKGVSTGDFTEALEALPVGAPGPRAVGHDYRSAQGRLAAGMGRMGQTVSAREALRVYLGRWGLFQHPAGGSGQ